jgi:hypothetical protein
MITQTAEQAIPDLAEELFQNTPIQPPPDAEPVIDPATARVNALYEATVDLPYVKANLTDKGLLGSEARLTMGDTVLFIGDDQLHLVSSKLSSTAPRSDGRELRMGIMVDMRNNTDPGSAVRNTTFQELIVDPQSPKKKGEVNHRSANGSHRLPMSEYLRQHQNKDGVAFIAEPTQELRNIGQWLRQQDGITPETISPNSLKSAQLVYDKAISTYTSQVALAVARGEGSPVVPSSIAEARTNLFIIKTLLVLDEIERQSTRKPPWEKY